MPQIVPPPGARYPQEALEFLARVVSHIPDTGQVLVTVVIAADSGRVVALER